MQWVRRLSLGTKLSLAIVATTLIALVVVVGLTMFFTLSGYRKANLKRATGLAEFMAAASVEPLRRGDRDAARELFRDLELVSNKAWVLLYDERGELFARHGAREPGMLVTPGPAREQLAFEQLAVRRPVMVGGEEAGWLVLGLDLRDQWQLLAWQGGVSAGIALLAISLCLPAVGLFRRRITASLDRLGRTMVAIARGKDYGLRVDYEAADEIGALVRQFNAMLDEVQKRDQWLQTHRELLEHMVDRRTQELLNKQQELAEKNRQLSREVRERREAEMIREEVERINSHDLKSSLNLVIGYPELLLRRGGLNPEQQLYLRRIETAGFRMLDLVKTQLDLFKMEKSIYRLKAAPVDLVQELCVLEEELAPLLAKRGVRLAMRLDGREVAGSEVVETLGEAPLLATMLRNLLINAVEASEEGDVVDVELSSEGRTTILIRNSQPVPGAIRHRFFEKYATHGKEEGTGLGTYSASLIARTHGALITMRTADAKGTEVQIDFDSPEAKPNPALVRLEAGPSRN
ncbi:MAG: HAMP domain-containing protein [Desulfovibrionaceae bacterium]